MRWQRTGGLLLLAFSLAACDTQVEQSGSTAAAEAELPAPGTVSYSPDTLAFIREQRPVVFNEREWWPQQQAVYDPLVTPVGTFEGVVLYTPADETLPYEHLFIPLDDGRWMGLLPTSDCRKASAQSGASSRSPESRRSIRRGCVGPAVGRRSHSGDGNTGAVTASLPGL